MESAVCAVRTAGRKIRIPSGIVGKLARINK
jgi:hypothetical protein